MKKLLTISLLAILLVACNKRGEVHEQPSDFIIIHGKTYKLISVVPAYDAHPIWILYPKDSNDAMPTIINYERQNGKTTVNQAVIKID